MPWNTDGRNARADATAALITHISLHSADPGGTGASEVTGGGYARIAPTYAAAAGGVAELSAGLDFATPADQTVTHIGMWAGATFLSDWARTSGDAAANAAGEYSVASAPITAS